jgi:thiol-disulfide isomerase/thioredoxin
MTDPSDAPAFASRSLKGVLALLALLAAGLGLLYVKGDQRGKKATDGACSASLKVAESVAPLAKGEVAAMSIAKTPEPMPELAFFDASGARKTLADFKGKTVLLNLWATWCVPCRQEMPALDHLQKEAGSDKFEVVTINIDTSRLERAKAFFNEVGVKSLAYYSDPKAEIFFQLKQTGKVMGLPTTFLIDSAGCQIGLMSGPAAWDSADGKALVTKAASFAP